MTTLDTSSNKSSNHSSNNSVKVIMNSNENSNFSSTPFAVPLPSSVFRGWQTPENIATLPTTSMDQGMVGTITYLGEKSIMVWFGWGNIHTQKAPEDSCQGTSKYSICDVHVYKYSTVKLHIHKYCTVKIQYKYR